MVVLKPLYGVPEAGMHWWATYSKHHKEKLSMEPSTYDPCLLISTKSKRVTRSVLALEIYGMVAGADLAYVIGSTLAKITNQLDLPTAPIVVCTDSFSLYECLVKLGTTKEKRLMIDIMALRQSYERRELYEIRWINGLDNPADAMTKAILNKALETFVSTNQMRVRIKGWVKRE